VSRLSGGTRGRLWSAGLVVVGLAAVYGVGSVTHPATAGSGTQLVQPSRATVSSAIRACPSPGSAGATAAGLATAASPGTASKGSAVVTRLTGAGGATSSVRTLTLPGMLRVSAIPSAPALKKSASAGHASSDGVTTSPGRGGVMVQATNEMAQGLEVEQTGAGGLVTAQCPGPGTDFWFVGPGATSTPQIELYLMNTDNQPADAEVDAVTDGGPLLGSTDTGIVVPPHGLVVQSLGKLLHSSRVIALHVSTSIGRVAVAVRETKSSADQGSWLPPAQAPAKSLVIPGLPGSSGSRELYLAVPGSGNAQVKVTAVTAKGSYQPTGGNGIDLAGGSAVSVELPSLSNVAAAIRISSSVPVTAAIKVPGGAAGSAGALSAATAPLTEQGIAADNPAGSSGSAELVISAPRTAVSVRIVSATSKITFAGQTDEVVQVPAGHTTVTKVKPPHGGKTADFAVLVEPMPGSGPVYVGRVISTGSTVRSILPMTSALTWVPLPTTRDSLDAARS
jgi:hypothetical protein